MESNKDIKSEQLILYKNPHIWVIGKPGLGKHRLVKDLGIYLKS